MVYGVSQGSVHRKKVRVPELRGRKGEQRIVCLTCYDASFARILESTQVDLVLVGDSLGNVIQGAGSTTGVSVSDIAYHTRCVAAALGGPLLVADMPFGLAGFSEQETFSAAHALVRAGAEAVKIEGATVEICAQISKLTRHGVPVMGHIGLLPQSVNTVGGYRLQGKSQADSERLVAEAKSLQEAGCFAIVLELVAEDVAKKVTASVEIPTIGIGSGGACDGQILVLNDMLGMNLSFSPKFLKRFAQLETTIKEAVEQYCTEVREGVYPPI
jgi:3-methyl-2-oxobutanoate hydroxymethyltransferase